jgi:hypothetical protein
VLSGNHSPDPLWVIGELGHPGPTFVCIQPRCSFVAERMGNHSRLGLEKERASAIMNDIFCGDLFRVEVD